MFTRFNRPWSAAAFSVCVLASTGCSSSDGNGGAGGTSAGGTASLAGASATGGNSVNGGSSGAGAPSTGGSPSGGAHAGGHGGAPAGTGGSTSPKAGAGGSVEAGEPCTANCPKGNVHTCFENCPLGPCDDALFYADALCSTVYPSAIDSSTIYCKRGQTASYCLTSLEKSLHYYVVECADGAPTVTLCSGGCGVSGDDKVAACGM